MSLARQLDLEERINTIRSNGLGAISESSNDDTKDAEMDVWLSEDQELDCRSISSSSSSENENSSSPTDEESEEESSDEDTIKPKYPWDMDFKFPDPTFITKLPDTASEIDIRRRDRWSRKLATIMEKITKYKNVGRKAAKETQLKRKKLVRILKQISKLRIRDNYPSKLY